MGPSRMPSTGRIQREAWDAKFSGQNPKRSLGCRMFRAESEEKPGMQNFPGRIQRDAWDAEFSGPNPKRSLGCKIYFTLHSRLENQRNNKSFRSFWGAGGLVIRRKSCRR